MGTTEERVDGIALAAHDKLKTAVEGVKGIDHVIRGQVNYQTNDIWRNRDEIIETTGSKVKDITNLAQDELQNPDEGAKGAKDIWRKHDDIVATTGNQVKGITTAARDGIKNAGDDAKGIQDVIKDHSQTDKIWRNHDEIMKTTGSKVKDFTNMAHDRLTGNKGSDVTNLAQDKLRNADADVKDMAKRAQDELGFRINIWPFDPPEVSKVNP